MIHQSLRWQAVILMISLAGVFAVYHADSTKSDGTLLHDHDGDLHQGPDEPAPPGVRIATPDIYQYFVPFSDDNLYQSFFDVIDSACLDVATMSRKLDSTISITTSSANTKIYFDHWEDGYDADPLNPAPGSTTVVSEIARAGAVQNWTDLIPIPRDQNTLHFDGRDRITIFGQPASAIRAAWIEQDPGALLAGAWRMAPVSGWGRRYILPIGEDLGRLQGGGPPFLDFDYVSFEIMAAYNGTTVQIDANADGVFEITQSINAGEATFVRGAATQQGVVIHSGAVINSTLPVQVQVHASNCRARYSGWSYTLAPIESWSNDYWSPVSAFTNGQNQCTIRLEHEQVDSASSADVDIYIYNPNSTPLAVSYEDASGAGTVTIPPHSTGSYLSLHPNFVRSNTHGVHLFSDRPFWAVTAVDSTSLDNSSSNFNWSYELLPSNDLSPRVIIGWAPGNAANPLTSASNSSTVYVEAVSDGTIVSADLDADGVADTFDINGDGDALDTIAYGYNETTSNDGVTLNRGQVLRISNPSTHDMTGAIIGTQDNNHPLAVVYGTDACAADSATPHLSLGYTVPAVSISSELTKRARLFLDADRSGDVSPGDILEYTVVAFNQIGTIIEPVIIGTLPYTYSNYIVGSLTPVLQEPRSSPTYDDGSGKFTYVPTGAPNTPDPNVHAFRITYPDLAPDQTIQLKFLVQLRSPIPPDVHSVTAYAVLASKNVPSKTADVTSPLNQVDLQIRMTNGVDTVALSQQISYIITYTNAGPGIAYNVVITDTLPPTAINVSSPFVPGVVTPTIEPGVIVFALGTLQAGQEGDTTVSFALNSQLSHSWEISNTVVIGTDSSESDQTNNMSIDIDRFEHILAHRIDRLPPYLGGFADVIINWFLSSSRLLQRFDRVEWIRQ